MFFTDLYFSRVFWIFLFLILGGVYGWYFYKKNLQKSSIFYFYDLRKLYVFASLFLSCFFLLITFLGPKTLFFHSETLKGSNIVFVLDVSKSMNVFDIGAGERVASRIDAAKKIIGDYVSNNPENRYALSIFAGKSDRSLPFTTDTNMFLTLLNGVNSKNISEGGTDIVGALEDGVQNFSPDDDSGVVVMLTDGGDEPLTQSLSSIEETFKKKNIAFMVVGMGTTQGGFIPIGNDVFGDFTYKVYNGRKVVSVLNTSLIRSLSSAFSGTSMFFDDISQYSTFSKKLASVGEKVNITKESNGTSLQYFFILSAFVFFMFGFCITIFDIPSLGKRK